jgi:hypothetical protein
MQPAFQPDDPILHLFDQLPLLNSNGNDNALKRNCPHRIEILREVELCSAEDIIKHFLVFFAKPSPVF